MGLWPKLEDALENKKVDDEISVTFEPGEVFGRKIGPNIRGSN